MVRKYSGQKVRVGVSLSMREKVLRMGLAEECGEGTACRDPETGVSLCDLRNSEEAGWWEERGEMKLGR